MAWWPVERARWRVLAGVLSCGSRPQADRGRLSEYPLVAARSRVAAVHGQPCSRAHFSTSRWPPSIRGLHSSTSRLNGSTFLGTRWDAEGVMVRGGGSYRSGGVYIRLPSCVSATFTALCVQVCRLRYNLGPPEAIHPNHRSPTQTTHRWQI